MTYSIAILGASGYTGAELIRLISEHPSMKIKVLGAYSKAGKTLAHWRKMGPPQKQSPRLR